MLPRAVDVSWRGVVPLLGSVHWPTVLALVGLWLLGLWVHTFVLTAAAPSLTHGRALTLNLTGSAVSNVVPLGGAAGVELNRRMMRGWGIDGRAFAGYTVRHQPLGRRVQAAAAGGRGGRTQPGRGGRLDAGAGPPRSSAGAGFAVVAVGAGFVLASPRGPVVVGRLVERWARRGLRLVGRDRELGVTAALADVRGLSAGLVAQGWLRMSAGIAGYVALQGLLLGLCLHVTGAGIAWPAVLAAFAVERALTVVPITPGGVGVADLGLVGVLHHARAATRPPWPGQRCSTGRSSSPSRSRSAAAPWGPGSSSSGGRRDAGRRPGRSPYRPTGSRTSPTCSSRAWAASRRTSTRWPGTSAPAGSPSRC